MSKKLSSSSPRRRGGGFTLEVQHLGEGLGGGPEVKAFARGVVVGGDESAEAFAWQGGKVGLARQEAAHSADRILDAAFLPGCVAIAEEGGDRQLVECAVAGELGAVVEGDGSAKARRQAAEQPDEMARHA